MITPTGDSSLDLYNTDDNISSVATLAGDPQTAFVQANMNGQQKPVGSPEQQENPLDEDRAKLFDYSQNILILRRIIKDWDTEVLKTAINRKTRDVEIDTEALRQKGQLDEDETIIPVRVIDTNITREQPAYVNYLKNSRRLAIFSCLSDPQQDTALLEQQFTQGMTYQGWENSFFKTIDGAQTHGWDAVEVVFNPLFPLNAGIEHIGHEMLFFPQTLTELQASPELIRAYDVTRIQLEAFVKDFGFSADQVKLYFSPKKDTQNENETCRIYKRLFKVNGIVHTAWFSERPETTDWLKSPEQMFIGIKKKQTVMVPKTKTVTDLNPIDLQPVTRTVTEQVPEEQWVNKPLTQYPIFLLPYRESEKPKLFDRKGRVFLDENKQECQTAILSGFVNGLTRAANIYASREKDTSGASTLKELQDLKLPSGRILSDKVGFWSPPYPDPMVLRALQYLDIANTQESGQVNFAVMNRDDSRKTATELDAANEQQQLLNSVSLTLFSTFLRQVLSLCWLIAQSQALQGNIVLLQIKVPVPAINPATGQPIIGPDGQPVIQSEQKINNNPVLELIYEVRAAGDVDVVQRNEKIQQMMADWPVIQQTPLAQKFLQDMMILKYPDKGQSYSDELAKGGQIQSMQSMIARLYTILDGSLKQNPHELDSLSPQDKSMVAQTMTEAQQYINQKGGIAK